MARRLLCQLLHAVCVCEGGLCKGCASVRGQCVRLCWPTFLHSCEAPASEAARVNAQRAAGEEMAKIRLPAQSWGTWAAVPEPDQDETLGKRLASQAVSCPEPEQLKKHRGK